MQKMKTIKLIAGQFSSEEARDILYSMLRSKIDFHCQKDFSSQERFGEPDLESQKRVTELREAKEDLFAFMQQALEENRKVKIASEIIISFD